jgi:hypothetical protein
VADAGRSLLLGLDGARQVVGDDGEPVPPTTVVAGNRAILAYRIESDDVTVPVSVTVASGTGWHVVGVLGAVGAPADVTAALASRGLDSMVGAAVPPGRGEVTLRWVPVTPTPTGVAPIRARRAAKKRSAKKVTKKQAPAKKAAAKKQAKKQPAKKQAPAKKAAAKKQPAKKQAKKQPAKKQPAKKQAKKQPAKKQAPAKKRSPRKRS